MSEQRKPVVPSDQIGMLAQFVRTLRLVWRLLNDPRVPSLTKLIVPVTLIYLFSPVDFMPDPILGLGQLDDLGVVVAGIALFIELCPHAVVEEHRRAIAAEAGTQTPESEDVIDGTFRQVPPDEAQTKR